MLTDREVALLYPLRKRSDLPAPEKREIENAWSNHWIDPAQVQSMTPYLPQGPTEASDALMLIGKAIQGQNRMGLQEKGTTRSALYNDPLQRISAVPGTLAKLNRANANILREVATQNPIIVSILNMLKSRLGRYCRPVRDGLEAMLKGVEGFDVWPRGRNRWDELSVKEEATREEIINFLLNSGDLGRLEGQGIANRETLRREPLKRMAHMYVEERYILDAYALEIEYTRNRSKLSGLYLVDGATILRTDSREWPYGRAPFSADNPDAAFVQVFNNQVVATFGSDDMMYEYANPRAALGYQGYGFSETEMTLRLTTGILNVMTTNNAMFDRSAIPPGILALTGNINTKNLVEFQQEWDAYRTGAGSQYGLPVVNLRDPQSKISFVQTSGMPSDMTNSTYISFLAAVTCATFGVDVTEINSSPFGGNNSALNSGKDTQTRLDEGKNKTVPPMVEGFFAPYQELVKMNWPGWEVTPVGLRREDTEKLTQIFLASATVDEVRQVKLGMPKLGGVIGAALHSNSAISQMMIASMGHGNIDANGNGVPDGQEQGKDKDKTKEKGHLKTDPLVDSATPKK